MGGAYLFLVALILPVFGKTHCVCGWGAVGRLSVSLDRSNPTGIFFRLCGQVLFTPTHFAFPNNGVGRAENGEKPRHKNVSTYGKAMCVVREKKYLI